jgi:hypothetical protein
MSTPTTHTTTTFLPAHVARGRSSWLLAMQLCSIVVLLLVLTSEAMRHWLVLPVLVSGILISKEAIDWLRSDEDPLDPIGLFSLFGIHFFFLSFLLHPLFDFYWTYPYAPNDWRPWLGYAAVLNCIGIVLYRLILAWYRRNRVRHRAATYWQLSRGRLLFLSVVSLATSASMQYLTYERFGGVSGMIESYTSRRAGEDPFEGLGWISVFAESFPVILAIAVGVLTRGSKIWRSPITMGVVMLLVFVSAIYFGGLKGSRSTIFFTLVWAAGILHFWVRPISKRVLVVFPLVLFLFMNVYLFYKRGGVEGILNIADPMAREELSQGGLGGQPELYILLHDFARADMNALVLFLVHTADDYEYAGGRSYLAAVLSVIPRAIWPDKPETLGKERAELLFGRGADVYVPYAIGMAGEAAMNFGPLAIPLTFVLVALGVVAAHAMLYRLDPQDGRLLLYPLIVVLCFVVPMGELESVIYTIVKNGFVPLLVVFLASDRVPRQA